MFFSLLSSFAVILLLFVAVLTLVIPFVLGLFDRGDTF